jgi:hypothetical protein
MFSLTERMPITQSKATQFTKIHLHRCLNILRITNILTIRQYLKFSTIMPLKNNSLMITKVKRMKIWT